MNSEESDTFPHTTPLILPLWSVFPVSNNYGTLEPIFFYLGCLGERCCLLNKNKWSSPKGEQM